MDETPIPSASFRISGHHHMCADLPRPWIVLPPSARASALSHPLLKPLLPSHVGFFPHAKYHRIARRHGADQAIFNYCVEGDGWCELDGRRHGVRPGDLMVLPPQQAHSYGTAPERPWTVYWFHAAGDHVSSLIGELGVSPRMPIVRLGRDPRLVALFHELLPILEEDYAFPQLLYASQLLTHLVGLMIRLQRQRLAEAPSARERVSATIRSMGNDLGGSVGVADLASRAGLSVSHYAELFRRLTGCSPKTYLGRLRLERAARLLQTTDDSVTSIARQLGFEDPLYFSRRFRAVHGIAPSDYRQGRVRAEK